MHEAPAPVEFLRLSENDVVNPGLVKVSQLFDPFEPYDLNVGCAVGEQPHEACLGTLADNVEGDELPAELHGGHLPGEIPYAVHIAPVEVMARKMPEQVVDRRKTQLLVEEFRPCRADAFDEFQLYVAEVLQCVSLRLSSNSATARSNGFVILMLSAAPSTSTWFSKPASASTDASSVNVSE